MKELKEAARLLGCDVGIYSSQVEDLGRRCTLPAIALMHNEARAGLATRNYPGHYVLIYAVDPGPDGKVHWYDGTYGFRFQRPKETFQKWWTGYVLTSPPKSRTQVILLWVTLVHVAAWLLILCFRHGRGARGTPSSRPAEHNATISITTSNHAV